MYEAASWLNNSNHAVDTARAAIDGVDSEELTRRFRDTDEFLFIDEFIHSPWLAAIKARLPNLDAVIHRNYIPRHKKGGSVSRYQLDTLVPEIPALYHDETLRGWLERLTGEKLLACPESDPHAYALYFYTEPGDHIGWHFDTSHYAGKRYTLLIGITDDSSSQLEFELYRNQSDRENETGRRHLAPGAICFFNGDKLYHRITPLGDNERRVSLTFEYVTNPRMSFWRRLISNFKDSIAYFGFRQAFLGGRTPS